MGQEDIIDMLKYEADCPELECAYEYLHDLYCNHSGLFMFGFRLKAVKEKLIGPHAPAVVVKQFKKTGNLPYTVADRAELWLTALDQKLRTPEEDRRVLYLKGLIFMAAYELIKTEDDEDED